MYGILNYICLIFMLNVGKCKIHGCFGYIMSNLYILLLTMERVISRGQTFPLSPQKLSIEKRPQETIAAVQIMARFFLGRMGGP